MANDCDYKVRISGNPENLQKVNESLNCEPIKNKGSLTLNEYPQLFKDSLDVEDWGSKWTVFNNIETDFQYPEDSHIHISGYSAWTPTLGFWQKLSKDFEVTIDLNYYERGNDFAGVVNFENGEEITHEQMTYWEYLYQYDTSYLWEEIMDQCTWDELSGVKETLGSVWMKLSSEEILKIEQQY